MDPKNENEEDAQPIQQDGQPSPGGLSQGINIINRIAGRGLSNPLGGVGTRVAAQAGQKAFAAFLGATAGVWIPIVIAVLSIFIFTFIIVGFGGGFSFQGNTETLTPAPAAP